MQVKALENFTFYNDDPIQVYKGQIFDMDEDAAEFYISEGKAEEVSDGGGGGADILIFYVYYNPKSPDTGTESGEYWNNATQAPYTFEEFSALYNSGTILFASFNGILSMVGYDDGSESFYTYGDWYNQDTHEWLHAGVCLDAVNGYWYDSYTYN